MDESLSNACESNEIYIISVRTGHGKSWKVMEFWQTEKSWNFKLLRFTPCLLNPKNCL